MKNETNQELQVVLCPSCDGTMVLENYPDLKKDEQIFKLLCPSCGYTQVIDGGIREWLVA